MEPGLDAVDRRRIDELSWYHTIDLAEGVATPGPFDLRHALPLVPFPDVQGKRASTSGHGTGSTRTSSSGEGQRRWWRLTCRT